MNARVERSHHDSGREKKTGAANDAEGDVPNVSVPEPVIDRNVESGEWHRHELGYYYQLMRRYPLYSHDQLMDLFRQYRNGPEAVSQEIAERILYSNVRLVISIARRYTGRGLPISDLVQEGLFSLHLKAIPGFEPDRGYHFSTYASWWIRSAINRALRDLRLSAPFRLPAYVQEEIAMAAVEARKIYAETGTWPEDTDLFERNAKTKSPEIRARRARSLARASRVGKAVSLSRPAFSGSAETLGDFVPDPRNAEIYVETDRIRECIERINAAICSLSHVEREIIRRRYGLDRGAVAQSLEIIGRWRGVTRERIRQIEHRAEKRLAALLRIPVDRMRDVLSAYSDMDAERGVP